MLYYTRGFRPHVEHSILFTVAGPKHVGRNQSPHVWMQGAARAQGRVRAGAAQGRPRPHDPSHRPASTTSVLTAATSRYITGAGITAGAGTALVLQLLLNNVFTLFPSQLPPPMGATSVILLTTSGYSHWVRYAPAAFLRSEGRFSGPLYGTEPWSPVCVITTVVQYTTV
jgi:hypothetical protein